MSGSRSRDKGARGELQVRDLLVSVWDGVKRGLTQTRGGDDCADVEGTPYHIEVKIGQRPNILKAMQQAKDASKGRPPVVFSKRDRGEWLVTMRSEDWIALNERAKGR